MIEWLLCDKNNEGFQMMTVEEIFVKIRKYASKETEYSEVSDKGIRKTNRDAQHDAPIL